MDTNTFFLSYQKHLFHHLASVRLSVPAADLVLLCGWTALTVVAKDTGTSVAETAALERKSKKII